VQELAVAVSETEPEPSSSQESVSWPTVTPPNSTEPVELEGELPLQDEQSEPPAVTSSQGQIGEAVIREVLGGELISEHPVASEDER
jgi:hypothetical protein